MRPARLVLLSLALIAVAILFGACSMLPASFSTPAAVGRPPADPAQPPLPGDAAEFRKAKVAWASTGIDSYTWQLDVLCECGMHGPAGVSVINDNVTGLTRQTGPADPAAMEGFPLTVDGVLDEAIRAIENGGRVDVAWGAIPGVPASMTIDPIPGAIDDELSFRVIGFEPAP